MISIIFGPPRIGKTAFLVYLLNCAAFDYERNYAMQEAIKEKNKKKVRKIKRSKVNTGFKSKQELLNFKFKSFNNYLLGIH